MSTGWLGDLRFALRQLFRHKLHSTTAILSLALGIGGTVALSSILHGLLLRPLPYAQAEQVQVLWAPGDWMQSELEFAQQRTAQFDALAGFSNWTLTLQSNGATEMVRVIESSAQLFDVLGRQPQLGRGFAAADQAPGAEPTVVLSHTLWRDRFGADPGLIGQQINLDGKATTVIGVAAADFYFPSPAYDAWRALSIDPASEDYRGNGNLTLIGRLGDGVGDDLAQQQVQTLAAALGEEYRYPEAWDKSRDAQLRSVREYLFGDVQPAVLLLFGSAGLLLLMACCNVAALVLVRVLERRSELALRGALGAKPLRLVQQITMETLLVAALAALLALLVAAAGFDLLVARLPLAEGFASTLQLHWPALFMAAGLALICGLATGLIPAYALLRGNVEKALTSPRSTSAGAAQGATHAVLIASQALIAVVLTIASVMLVRTVDSLQRVDLGLRSESVVSADLVSNSNQMSGAQRAAFYARVMERVQAMPGVSSAGMTNRLPIRDGGWIGGVGVPSRPDLAGNNRPNVVFRSASPGFFEAMGVGLLQGRLLQEGDRADSELVTVVSESFAQTMWPGESALGKQIQTRFEGSQLRTFTIVGVTREMRLFDLTSDNPWVMTIPTAQLLNPGTSQVLVMRTQIPPTMLERDLIRLVREEDSQVAVTDVTAMTDVVDGSMTESLQLRFYLSLLAGTALLLGGIGVFGVVNHLVSRRRAEYAVRLALGSSSSALLGQVLRAVAKPIFVGGIAGVLVIVAGAQWLTGFLYGLPPADPLSIATGVAALLLSALAAALLPALRATRISPSDTLRES